MCIMSTPKPKVEKVAPAPTAQTQTETAAFNDRTNELKRRQRAAKGADWARNQAEGTMLTNAASSGNRQTLG